MGIRTFFTAVLAALLFAPPAAGADLYLNGVNINGLKSQEFKNCSVSIDSAGNIWITAKDYTVSRDRPPAETRPGPEAAARKESPSKRYWLVAERKQGKCAGYDIDVYVNGKWVRKVKGSEDQVVAELTPWLAPGPNTIKIAAVKSRTVKADPGGAVSLIIGEGIAGTGSLVMETPLVDYRRSAEESDPFVNEYTIEAR